MLLNVGYKFDRTKKSWLAAFMIAAGPLATMAAENGHHYELLDLKQIEQRAEMAQKVGDMASLGVYRLAEDAIEDTIRGERASPLDLPDDFDKRLYSVTTNGEKFKVIDPVKDVDWTEFFLAQKTAQVKAEKVSPGTVVETIMSDGHVETTKTAGPDGGYRVTNPTGEQYLVDTAKFEKIYEATDREGVFQPKPDPRKVLPVQQNISFQAPWGEEMKIREGGVLVRDGKKGVYGIQPDEYSKTYKPT